MVRCHIIFADCAYFDIGVVVALATLNAAWALTMSVSSNLSPGFRTLEFHRTSWTRLAGSLVLHSLAFAFLLVVPWTAHEIVQQRQAQVTPLIEPPAPPPPRPHLPTRAIVSQKVPPPPPVKPPVAFKAPPPKPEVAPPKQILVQELPAPVPQPIKQEVAKLDLPQLETPAIPRPAPVVKTGGFGNPDGAVPSSASTNKGLSAPSIGSFDMPAGSSYGRGNGARQVAVAGFGDAAGASGGVSGGNSHGSVRTGGFGSPETVPVAASHPVPPAAPLETPVEITFKPKPAYTEEARAKKIEGEVLLEVLFSANGHIHVLRVMRGLGFGLDENARTAASQIRFQPGTRGGAPVDMKGTVHIVFELS